MISSSRSRAALGNHLPARIAEVALPVEPPIRQGSSYPTRLTAPTKKALATAWAGCSSLHRYSDNPATVAEGLNTHARAVAAAAPCYEERLGPTERSVLDQALAVSVVGSPETVRHGLEEFIRKTGVDELMVTSQIFDHEARLRSFQITAAARDAMEVNNGVIARG